MAVETESPSRADISPERQAGQGKALGRDLKHARSSGARKRRPAVLVRFAHLRFGRSLVFSPLTRRILVLNVVALAILVVGLVYLGEYQRNLVQGQLDSLATQARIFSGALGESAVKNIGDEPPELQAAESRILLRRLIEPTRARARLFDSVGDLVVDSRYLEGPGGAIQIEPLPPPDERGFLQRLPDRVYDWLVGAAGRLGNLPRYREQAQQHASDYREVVRALSGETAAVVYNNAPRGMILSVAVPVQHYREVVGALMVSQDSAEIDAAMRNVRVDILKAFGVALLITVFFSFYLGSTIVRPIRRLALAAERIGPGHGHAAEIPDFTARRDEIGYLSAALRRMTTQLSQRMEAIERFAADVAHEIKNPLSSLRSAVETAARVKEQEQQRKLMAIILEDVHRLDRLISDISDASRLDAALSRDAVESVDLGALLGTLCDVYGDPGKPEAPRLRLYAGDEGEFLVSGLEGRLAQVFRNLIENALSFSPPGGTVTLSLRHDGEMIEAVVEDEGPGLPEGKFETIFERFYSERPAGEKFGTHSGLGLSISKQIVDVHGGTIRAENRRDAGGRVRGARFIVRLLAQIEGVPSQD
ncbi:MAG TPA: stimulus-sensing domain-containing protein [Alphaproteobacteria bacterium]|nr:stimulus-sensing domain-containing protein [Alphaproteobacteria bacterium]